MVNDITWFQKEAGEVVKGGTSEVTMVSSVLLTISIIVYKIVDWHNHNFIVVDDMMLIVVLLTTMLFLKTG